MCNEYTDTLFSFKYQSLVKTANSVIAYTREKYFNFVIIIYTSFGIFHSRPKINYFLRYKYYINYMYFAFCRFKKIKLLLNNY